MAVLRTIVLVGRGFGSFLGLTDVDAPRDETTRGLGVLVDAEPVRLVTARFTGFAAVLLRVGVEFVTGFATARFVLLAVLGTAVLRLGLVVAAARAAVARAAAAPRRGGLAASTAGS